MVIDPKVVSQFEFTTIDAGPIAKMITSLGHGTYII